MALVDVIIGYAKGAQGDVGPQGPTGPQGPEGPQGPLPPLVNNALATEAGVAALDSAMGPTFQNQINTLNSNLDNVNSNLLLKANASDLTPSRTTLNSVINAVYIDRTGNFRVVSVYNDAATSITITAYAKYGIGTLPVGDRINRRFSAPVFARNASTNTIFTGVTLLLDNTDNNIYLVNQTSSDITFNQMYAEKSFVVGIA